VSAEPVRAYAGEVRRPDLAQLLVPAAALVLSIPLALSLSRYPPPFALELAAGTAFAMLVVLAVVRLEAAAVVGFALLGIVVSEPAPADVAFLVVIAVALATGRFRSNVPPVALAALGAFLALNLLSAIEAVDGPLAAFYLGTTAYLILLAFWISGFVDSRARARLVAGGYLVAAAASAAVGTLALFIALPGREVLVQADRAQALFQDPNVFGPFLVPIALVLVEDLLTPRLFGMRRLVKAALLGLLVLGVVVSYSRGAWANLAVGAVVLLAVLALRHGGGRKLAVLLALAALVTGFVAAILVATGSQDFLLERAQIQEYDTGRFAGQAVGLQSAERYPLGLGPGQFESYASISAHSAYVRAFAEQGVLGLVVYAAFLASTLAAAVSNAVAGRETYGVGSAALLGAFCGMLVSSFVVDTLHWRHFWVVVALVWAGWARRKALTRRPANAPTATR
jgi:O-antigen ligase